MGIEVLRVLSMLGIVMLHVLGQGGILDAVEWGTPQYVVAWTMEILAYPSVDAFALISGYVGFGSSHRLSTPLRLLCMALFFDFTVTIVAVILGVDLSIKEMIGSLVPPVIGGYWYLTCYLCLYVFMPTIDGMVMGMGERDAQKAVMVTLFLLSIVPTLLHGDFAGDKHGYSALWLGALYFVGACMRRHGWLKMSGGGYLSHRLSNCTSKYVAD